MRKTSLYFGLGAVAGSAVTALFFLFKEGLVWAGEGEQIVTTPTEVQTNIPEKEDSEKPIVLHPEAADPHRVNYSKLVEPYRSETMNQPVKPARSDIYSASEEDFYHAARSQEYDVKALTVYLEDKIVADSVTDRIFTPVELPEILGSYNLDYLLKWFESHEVLYICNEPLHTQYEITFDDRSYKEVTGR